MLVLLPPSESKIPGTNPGCVDVAGLWQGRALSEPRMDVAQALMQVSGAEGGLSVLKVGPSLAGVVRANLDLLVAPTAPAFAIYSGVLFEGMQAAQLPDDLDNAALTQVGNHVFVQSALWGLVSLTDSIPAYRLSMDTDLPGVGKLAAFWKTQLAQPMNDMCAGQIVLDCRSGAYQKAWNPTAAALRKLRTTVVKVGAAKRMENGGYKTVSHWAKHYRGVLAGHMLRMGLARFDDIDQVVDALNGMRGSVIDGFTFDMEPQPTITVLVNS